MVVPRRHHRYGSTETVKFDSAVQLFVACGKRRDVGAICRPCVTIDIVADQQKRLRFLRGNDIPEFHIAVFVDAAAKGKTCDHRIDR